MCSHNHHSAGTHTHTHTRIHTHVHTHTHTHTDIHAHICRFVSKHEGASEDMFFCQSVHVARQRNMFVMHCTAARTSAVSRCGVLIGCWQGATSTRSGIRVRRAGAVHSLGGMRLAVNRTGIVRTAQCPSELNLHKSTRFQPMWCWRVVKEVPQCG